MDSGEEVRVEVESEELDRDEFVLYRVGPRGSPGSNMSRARVRQVQCPGRIC